MHPRLANVMPQQDVVGVLYEKQDWPTEDAADFASYIEALGGIAMHERRKLAFHTRTQLILISSSATSLLLTL
jgi:hypothetical protein